MSLLSVIKNKQTFFDVKNWKFTKGNFHAFLSYCFLPSALLLGKKQNNNKKGLGELSVTFLKIFL